MPTNKAGPPLDAGRPTDLHAAPTKSARAPRGLKITLIVAAGVAVLVVATGLIGRSHDASAVKTWTGAQAAIPVTVIHPTAGTGAQALVLPGNLAAWYNAQIFSRVSGYVHGWYDDIGAKVKAGQLLATIDTPELDQQLIQARADLASAKANRQLADTTAKRWSALLAQDAVSKQESEEKSGDFLVKSALVNAAEANLNRLLALKSFSRIVAPFAGVVTARKTDIGALVNAGAGASSTTELFDVAKIDRLRLYVHVPQNYSARITPHMTATLTAPEYPGKTFNAVLTSTSNAISDASGTLLAELEVANPDDALKAGDYVQVTFDLPNAGQQGSGFLSLPSSALLFLKTGLEAAVVGSDDRVHLTPVTVARDLGSSMQIASGLTPADRVIDNPPDSITDGERVRVMTPGGHAAD
jgi:multidrug efflux system membrane fusion protein